MDYREIKTLADKYWRCETTAEEEKILKDFFSKEQVPEEFVPIAGLFKYYSALSELTPSGKFSPGINGQSDLPLKPSKVRSMKPAWYYRIAAAVILVLAVFVINNRV